MFKKKAHERKGLAIRSKIKALCDESQRLVVAMFFDETAAIAADKLRLRLRDTRAGRRRAIIKHRKL